MQYGAPGWRKHEQKDRSEKQLDDVTMSRKGYSSSITVIWYCSLKGLGEYMLKYEDSLSE